MGWICESCLKGKHECKFASFFCTCECNNGGFADIAGKVITTVSGAGMAAGGLAITISTFGIAAPVGGALMGAGISTATHGIEKSFSGERINLISLGAEISFGAATGALTGGVGAVGEVVAANAIKTGAVQVVKAGAIKLGVRAAAGATTGVAAKVVDEVKQCVMKEKTWTDFGKTVDQNGKENGTAISWTASAVVGALGGAGTHITSNATKLVASAATKSVISVGVSGVTAAASDGVIQGANIAAGNQETYDFRRTVRCATVSATTAAACEGARSGLYRLKGGKDNLLHDKAQKKTVEDNVPPEFKEKVIDQAGSLEKMDQKWLNEESRKADAITQTKKMKADQQLSKQNFDSKIQKVDQEIEHLRQNSGNDQQNRIRELGRKRQSLINEKKASNLQFKEKLSNQPNLNRRADMVYNEELGNAHFLVGDKLGQVACDVNPDGVSGRGSGRAIYDVDQKNRVILAGFTSDHEYKSTPNFGESDYYGNKNFYENKLAVNENASRLLIHNGALVEEQQKEEEKRKDKDE